MSDYYIVEAHAHAFQTREIGLQAMGGKTDTGYTGTIEDLLASMKKSGISQAVMLSMLPAGDMREAARGKIPQSVTPAQRQEAEKEFEKVLLGRYQRRNQWMCEVGQGHPNLAPLLTTDPGLGRQAIREELEGGLKKGAKGIKLHPNAQRFHPSGENMWPIYEIAQELGLPIVFDSGKFNSPVQYGEPEKFVGMLARFPKLTVILAHLGRGFYGQTRAIAPKYPNLCFDCSDVITADDDVALSDTDLVSLIKAVGAERIMFGSDFPWYDPGPGIQRLLRLPFTEKEKRLILGENALRIYKLPRR
ncbi:MAG: amidohydrolase family protein [Chloroflexota bacterium]|nr:amidohydrolase family protein [Chloroflexota bacterium]